MLDSTKWFTNPQVQETAVNANNTFLQFALPLRKGKLNVSTYACN